jgi:beta-glucosidase
MQFFLKVLFCLALLLTRAAIVAAQPNAGGTNKNAQVEQRINALIARMTLAEKLGQLQQLDGEYQGNARPEHFEMARKGLLGSTLNVRGAKFTNELQRAAMESRL